MRFCDENSRLNLQGDEPLWGGNHAGIYPAGC